MRQEAQVELWQFLERRGWGGFDVGVTIKFKHSSISLHATQTRSVHMLEFGASDTAETYLVPSY